MSDHRFSLTGQALFALVGATSPAAAADMGATSQGTITIRVSVAPRIWSAAPDQLCVTVPLGSFTLRTPSNEIVPFALLPGGCGGRSSRIQIKQQDLRGSLVVVGD
jgi:hypothetical protein